LCTRGASSFTRSSPSTSNSSTASTPTKSSASRILVAMVSARSCSSGERPGAGARLVRRMPPRYWTIEGAETSQFENHLRAILGWPLGSTDAVALCAMVNCIGALPDPEAALAVSNTHLHAYGKEPRPGRKVGHLTVTATNPDELDAHLVRLQGLPGTVDTTP
jgi:hypothetical protein